MNFIVTSVTESLTDPVSATARQLAAGLSADSGDHTVTYVGWLKKGRDPKDGTLARKLDTISVQDEGRNHELIINEGRYADGYQTLYLAHAEKKADAFTWQQRAKLLANAIVLLSDTASYWSDDFRVLTVGAGSATLATNVGSVVKAPVTALIENLRDIESAGLTDRVALFATSEKVAAALEARFVRPVGLLPPGIDTQTWDPEDDKLIDRAFSATEQKGKSDCKHAVMFAHGHSDAQTPLFVVFVDALTQAMVDALTMAALNDVQLVVMAAHDDGVFEQRVFEQWTENFADRVRVVKDYAEADEHRYIAAADFVVANSSPHAGQRVKAAQCAKAAQRYGALPIVKHNSRAAAGIVHCDSKATTGTGLIYHAGELGATLQAATSLYYTCDLKKLRRRLMAIDNSWKPACTCLLNQVPASGFREVGAEKRPIASASV